MIISEAPGHDESELQKFHYGKQKQDELIKLLQAHTVRVGGLEPGAAFVSDRRKVEPAAQDPHCL